MATELDAPHTLTLTVLASDYAVCRLGPCEPMPDWAARAGFCSVTRTEDELSIVCREDSVPAGVTCERGWAILQVAGPLDFGLVGVLAGLAAPLTAAGISLFAVSTYDTDYLLVRRSRLARALEALRDAGHTVGLGHRRARVCPGHARSES